MLAGIVVVDGRTAILSVGGALIFSLRIVCACGEIMQFQSRKTPVEQK